MTTDSKNQLKKALGELEQARRDIYDYDYDSTVLECVDNAIMNVKNAISMA